MKSIIITTWQGRWSTRFLLLVQCHTFCGPSGFTRTRSMIQAKLWPLSKFWTLFSMQFPRTGGLKNFIKFFANNKIKYFSSLFCGCRSVELLWLQWLHIPCYCKVGDQHKSFCHLQLAFDRAEIKKKIQICNFYNQLNYSWQDFFLDKQNIDAQHKTGSLHASILHIIPLDKHAEGKTLTFRFWIPNTRGCFWTQDNDACHTNLHKDKKSGIQLPQPNGTVLKWEFDLRDWNVSGSIPGTSLRPQVGIKFQ